MVKFSQTGREVIGVVRRVYPNLKALAVEVEDRDVFYYVEMQNAVPVSTTEQAALHEEQG